MRALGLSLPRAYCFVRARRLNVIIQPHLRFIYELLKWEETLQQQQQQQQQQQKTRPKSQSSPRQSPRRRQGEQQQEEEQCRDRDENIAARTSPSPSPGPAGEATGFRRELEWAELAREIALMNRPYAR